MRDRLCREELRLVIKWSKEEGAVERERGTKGTKVIPISRYEYSLSSCEPWDKDLIPKHMSSMR
jgi:hypothetical protein